MEGIFMESILIDSFPKILEEVPEFIPELQRYNGWRKNRTPSTVLQNWECETRSTKFYFLGWLRESTKRYGAGTMLHFSLHQKWAISGYVDEILKEEATKNDERDFERGRNESYRKNSYSHK
jgi:hypothetical protein